jgi:lipopolysaccharide biosynthesis glycosyltransferase
MPEELPRDCALAFAADEQFALGLAVAVSSTLKQLAPGLVPKVYVLDNGLACDSRLRLERVVQRISPAQLRWIQVPPERLAHLGTHPQFTHATYARLLAPELLGRNVGRLVYLDSDVLVRRDLSPLFDIDLDGAPFGAVRDFTITTTEHEASGIRRPVLRRPYFNAGLLVIDVARWRDTDVGTRALAYAAEGSEPLPWLEQDALNAVAERWFDLDYMWNLQHMRFFRRHPPAGEDLATELYDQRLALYRNAAVLHFTGQKPWHGSCTTRGTGAWLRALLASRWYRPHEALRWLVGYAKQRMRYALGTAKRRILRTESPA